MECKVLTGETAKHHDIVRVEHEFATGSLLIDSSANQNSFVQDLDHGGGIASIAARTGVQRRTLFHCLRPSCFWKSRW